MLRRMCGLGGPGGLGFLPLISPPEHVCTKLTPVSTKGTFIRAAIRQNKNFDESEEGGAGSVESLPGFVEMKIWDQRSSISMKSG